MNEQRRSKRFDMQLPLEIQRTGSQRVARTGRTRNISSGGVLFTCDAQVEVGGVIEYIVNLPNSGGGFVSLRCLGKADEFEFRQSTQFICDCRNIGTVRVPTLIA